VTLISISWQRVSTHVIRPPLHQSMNCLASSHFISSRPFSFHFMSFDSTFVHLFPWYLQGTTDTRRHLPDAVSRVPLLGGSLPLCGAPPSHSRGPHSARTSLPGQPPHLCFQSCTCCLSVCQLLLSVSCVCLSVCLFVCLFFCLSVCVSFSCCLSVCLCVCLSVCQLLLSVSRCLLVCQLLAVAVNALSICSSCCCYWLLLLSEGIKC